MIESNLKKNDWSESKKETKLVALRGNQRVSLKLTLTLIVFLRIGLDPFERVVSNLKKNRLE